MVSIRRKVFSPFSNNLRNIIVEKINNTTRYSGFNVSGSFIYWNFLPHLVIIIVSMFLYKWTPRTSLMSLIIFSRFPAILLTAPASQFKYYYSFYIYGLIVIFIMIAEKKYVIKERDGFNE